MEINSQNYKVVKVIEYNTKKKVNDNIASENLFVQNFKQ